MTLSELIRQAREIILADPAAAEQELRLWLGGANGDFCYTEAAERLTHIPEDKEVVLFYSDGPFPARNQGQRLTSGRKE